jgi:hypothetical protein
MQIQYEIDCGDIFDDDAGDKSGSTTSRSTLSQYQMDSEAAEKAALARAEAEKRMAEEKRAAEAQEAATQAAIAAKAAAICKAAEEEAGCSLLVDNTQHLPCTCAIKLEALAWAFPH